MKNKKTKSLFCSTAKFCLILFTINYMFNLIAVAQVIDTVKPLPSIFVPKEVSDARRKWFNDHKYNTLNRLAIKDGAKRETQEVYFKNAKIVSNILEEFLRFKNMDGMHIYFGSRRKKKEETENEDKDSCGKIKLIMAPTQKSDDVTSLFKRKYYTFNNGVLIKISKKSAKNWIKKYQNLGEKRRALDSTLTDEDRINGCFETKHIFFSNNKVKELIKEINDHVQKKITGIKIRLVSYDDSDSIPGIYGGRIKQAYKQRLSIDFVFTNDLGVEVYDDEETLIARKKAGINNNINLFLEKNSKLKGLISLPNTVENWNSILLLLNSSSYLKERNMLNMLYAMDTGAPAPPPSGSGNMATLDIEP